MIRSRSWMFSLVIVALLATVAALFVMMETTQSASADDGPKPITGFNAGDYVIFSQARDGKAEETFNNGSNDAQASVSGSDNSVFGRIRSNADFSSAGQNIYYHYEGNGLAEPVQPSTVNDGKVTYTTSPRRSM